LKDVFHRILSLNLFTMKHLFLICLFCAGLGSWASAQQLEPSQVPAEVTTAFSAKFADAEKVVWELNARGTYDADFEVKGKNHDAVFDKTGKWLETETKVAFDALPQPVKDAWNASAYAKEKIEEIEVVETPEVAMYYEFEVKVSGKEWDIQYLPDGKLLAAFEDKD
jgi:Putative beta-lactamase-inhibitor-like, PepSY-like